MRLTLGFSPCPNDTFIFDALIHNKIDTHGLKFDVHYEDVETLNKYANEEKLDITKLSYFAYAKVVKNYFLLDSGSALGFGVGPLLISKKNPSELWESTSENKQLKPELKVGIPGEQTTANLLLQIAHPELKNKQIMLFSDIEDALLNDEIDLGLIIHENRFTYASKGLYKIIDLGNFWEEYTGSAIPLGGIAIHKRIPRKTQLLVQKLICESVEFAFKNPDSGAEFIKFHAQEMDEKVIKQHINLYVNEFSKSLGTIGRKSIDHLFEHARIQKLIDKDAYPNYL
ncbi:1,4-dihydroxy-6-naphthoate synthase [Pedobacter flavus]|uniref:1,4-dihydroxy-6-naphtoate synthase n=1 Tax=Pedobacter flavus TaxID=3113906 RepID=A0ABU7H026_9SPHI|nr:1,4-dihydroxy-6-naphthoate synthase [Pedobacter sp. VNH31]MEE1884595.1 1,4-dihydroxy-6-naphthoate synthase [Pedobacter sp. VNH31]